MDSSKTSNKVPVQRKKAKCLLLDLGKDLTPAPSISADSKDPLTETSHASPNMPPPHRAVPNCLGVLPNTAAPILCNSTPSRGHPRSHRSGVTSLHHLPFTSCHHNQIQSGAEKGKTTTCRKDLPFPFVLSALVVSLLRRVPDQSCDRNIFPLSWNL